MKVVICADKAPKEPYYLFLELLASLRRFGHEPLILGWGERWTGLGSKPRMLKQAIESGRITDDRIIFADAYDVIFESAPEAIDELALKFYGNRLIFNAEKTCFPDASLAEKHPPTTSSFRYLNSGFSIGATGDYLYALKWMKADEIPDDSRDEQGRGIHPNDQDNWMRAFLSGKLPIALDTRCVLCQTLHGVTMDEFCLESEFIENRAMGSFPMAFHANGGSKTSGVVEPILRKLKLR